MHLSENLVRSRPHSIVKLALLGFFVLTIATSAYGREEPTAYAKRIAPFSDLQIPRGAGPHPLAILLPGCLNWQPHHGMWRKRLLKNGFAVLHLDSFAIRRIRDRGKMLNEVCTGSLMSGSVRAGDLMAMLPSIWERFDIDQTKTVLMGWSHGGWAASDFLSMVASGDRPPNLTVSVLLKKDNFKAAFLFYPYCGAGSISPEKGFPDWTMSIIFHGLKDRITSANECETKAEQLSKSGGSVEFVGFDQALHWYDNHTQEKYDKGATRKTNEIVEKMLLNVIDSNYKYRGSDDNGDLLELFEEVMTE